MRDLRDRGWLAALLGLSLFACGADEEATAGSEGAVVVESSPDARTKIVLARTSFDPEHDGSVVLYCERAMSEPSQCPPGASVAMAYATYAARVGEAVDQSFPEFREAVAQPHAGASS